MTPAAVGRWTVDRWRGPPGRAHGEAWPPAAVPAVRVVEAVGTAIVLGSTQPSDVVDHAVAAERHVSVVRRRSGGGAVLVGTGDVVWIDVFVPTGDVLWDHDVGRATHWLGRAWVDALTTLGVEADWHAGGLVAGPWSSLVCFAGLGPGEVRTGGAKVVGMSQRRTRAGTLLQCAALLHWDPVSVVGFLRLSDAERSRAERDLAGVAVGVTDTGAVPGAAVEEAFVDRLSSL